MNELLQEGKYRITNKFEHDENSCVYEALDTVNNRNVVIKEIPVKLNKVMTHSQQESIKVAFANEARVLTEIKHDSLVRVLDFFSEIGRQYLVLETVEGSDLAEVVKVNGEPFNYAEASQWADQILDALTYLHQIKPPVMHRAIKPKNIRLLADGKVKLVAYGLADGHSNLDTDQAKDAAVNYSPIEIIWESLDSASQKVIGNSYDEKSEAILKQPADAKTDIFGLAATMYFLLTAKKPVDALERSIDMLDGKADPLSPPHVVNPSVPIEVSNVVVRGMEIKRENRFDSASMMRQALKTSLVLIKEREDKEALKQNDALLDQNIAQLREQTSQYGGSVSAPGVVEPVIEHFDPVDTHVAEPVFAKAELSEADMIKQQLREAEAQRKVAEERAAEAERLLRERDLALNPLVRAEVKERPEPAAYVPTAADVRSDLNMLAADALEEKPIIEPDVFVPQIQEPAVEPIVETFAAPINTLNEHISASPDFVPAAQVLDLSYDDANPIQDLADPISLDGVIDMPEADEHSGRESSLNLPFGNSANEPEVSAYESKRGDDVISPVGSDHDESPFTSSYADNIGSGFPVSIPMIAGIAAVLLVAVIGGWYVFANSAAPEAAIPEPVAVQPQAQVEQQQPVTEPETAVTTEPEVTAEPEQTEIQPAIDETSAPTQTALRSQPTKQPAKARQSTTAAAPSTAAPSLPPPPKTQTAKKKLTVDDLLKDN